MLISEDKLDGSKAQFATTLPGNPAQRETMGIAARQKILAHFPCERMVAETLALYQSTTAYSATAGGAERSSLFFMTSARDSPPYTRNRAASMEMEDNRSLPLSEYISLLYCLLYLFILLSSFFSKNSQ
ncbi:hypothetical protein EI42_03168 [Thermosporothrix hazakensis]|jgi:hypothetical protein|uniref:Uncharacterized protein n=1 Tax=Thermosporothrix hazakensis TaxID=644383 RepID=A0A326U632_THEHA|nr:hypothetical protein EI42_03168 [Thermosporothrix hazakensis]